MNQKQTENVLDYNHEDDFTINGEIINDAVYEDESLEYRPAFLDDFVNELINRTAEATGRDNGDFELMKADLKILMNKEDEFFLSSNSTNRYLFKGDTGYDEAIALIAEINDAII